MALKLYIPPCIDSPRHCNHPPPIGKPLRLQIQGPLISIRKLLPGFDWGFEAYGVPAFLPGGSALARLTFEAVYGRPLRTSETLILRNEYLGWIMEPEPRMEIDYYGVTIDYLVPENDTDPEILAIGIAEMDYDGGAFARECLRFQVNPEEYTNKRVLAVPRCCQKKKGTQDRKRINGEVEERAANGILSRLVVRGLAEEGEGSERQ